MSWKGISHGYEDEDDKLIDIDDNDDNDDKEDNDESELDVEDALLLLVLVEAELVLLLDSSSDWTVNVLRFLRIQGWRQVTCHGIGRRRRCSANVPTPELDDELMLVLVDVLVLDKLDVLVDVLDELLSDDVLVDVLVLEELEEVEEVELL